MGRLAEVAADAGHGELSRPPVRDDRAMADANSFLLVAGVAKKATEENRLSVRVVENLRSHDLVGHHPG
jgi:hypothetical protein